MKPINFRNASYEGLRADLDAIRAQVYTAWVCHGPGTTREISRQSGIDLLTFRPRTTDLCQMGLVTLDEEQPDRTEGRYRAATAGEWERFREAQVEGQLQLL